MCGDCGGCGVYLKSPHFVVIWQFCTGRGGGAQPSRTERGDCGRTRRARSQIPGGPGGLRGGPGIWKCIKGRCNQHQLSLLTTMAGNTSSKYSNPDPKYCCPDCDYETNERVNLDIHSELNHKTTSSPTNEELIEAIEVWKIYKLLQRMKTKEVSTGFW